MAVFNFCYDLATSLLVFLVLSLKLLSLDYLGVFDFLLKRPCDYLISIDDISRLSYAWDLAHVYRTVPFSLFTTFLWVAYDSVNAQHLNSFLIPLYTYLSTYLPLYTYLPITICLPWGLDLMFANSHCNSVLTMLKAIR